MNASVPVLKYEEKVRAIPRCPPDPCTEETGDVFRFVRAEIADPWNFTPQAMKDPKRKFKDDEEACSGYALSVFRSAQEARAFYVAMRNKRLKVNLILGTHLATVPITPADGRLTVARSDGHRDWHEYATSSCASGASIIEQLHVEG